MVDQKGDAGDLLFCELFQAQDLVGELGYSGEPLLRSPVLLALGDVPGVEEECG
jgi:hypothetical protein